jgi:hypothetical protein
MATIDIREVFEKDEIDTILFGYKNTLPGTAIPYKISYNERYVVMSTGERVSKDSEYGEETYLCIRKSDVKNVIKALEKAVELGWGSDD